MFVVTPGCVNSELTIHRDTISAEDDDLYENDCKVTRYLNFRQDVGHFDEIFDNFDVNKLC